MALDGGVDVISDYDSSGNYAARALGTLNNPDVSIRVNALLRSKAEHVDVKVRNQARVSQQRTEEHQESVLTTLNKHFLEHMRALGSFSSIMTT
jgi:hypothetical protein